MPSTVPVLGLSELRKQLLAFPQKVQRRALDKAMLAGARVIAAEARKLAPVRQAATWEGGRSGGVTRPAGATKRNIVAKRGQKRYATGADSYFIVGVRHGKTNTNATNSSGKRRKVSSYDLRGEDPFYWRFQEFGFTAVGRRAAQSGNQKRKRIRPTGRYIPGRFFMTKAFRAATPAALNKVRDTLAREIAKL